MPKLTNKAIYLGRTDERTDGRTDPNFRKASLLKTQSMFIKDLFFFTFDIFKQSFYIENKDDNKH